MIMVVHARVHVPGEHDSHLYSPYSHIQHVGCILQQNSTCSLRPQHGSQPQVNAGPNQRIQPIIVILWGKCITNMATGVQPFSKTSTTSRPPAWPTQSFKSVLKIPNINRLVQACKCIKYPDTVAFCSKYVAKKLPVSNITRTNCNFGSKQQ